MLMGTCELLEQLYTPIGPKRYMWVMRYKKAFRFTKKVWAHDEHSECRVGDVVRVQPLGYRLGPWKTYVLARVLHREPRDDELAPRASESRNLLLSRWLWVDFAGCLLRRPWILLVVAPEHWILRDFKRLVKVSRKNKPKKTSK